MTLAGAGVGALGTATSFGAVIVSKVMKSTRSKEAHEHIKLDQQLSSNVNDIANEYNRAQEKAKMKKTDMAHCTLGIGSHASVGGFKSRPTAVQIGLTSGRDIAKVGLQTGILNSAAAIKIGGKVITGVGTMGLRAAAITGGVVSGLTLVVTAPLNIYQIASDSYHLVKSSRDVENEKDSTCKWYMNKIEEMKRELHCIENIISHMELEEDDESREEDDESREEHDESREEHDETREEHDETREEHDESREMPHCKKIWFLNSAARTTAIVVAILTILIFLSLW